MNMIKYRVHEVAKDFGVATRLITNILTDYCEPPINHMQVLEKQELDVIFEYMTQHNQVDSLEEIFHNSEASTKTVSDTIGQKSAGTGKAKNTELTAFLEKLFRDTRKANQSFWFGKPDDDLQLSPSAPVKGMFEVKGTLAKGDTPAPIWELISESWKENENRSIVIEGGAGTGKTVTLLNPPRELPAPVLYVCLYDMVERDTILSITDYLQKKYPEWAREIERLASRPWNNGPSVIMLLDGFDDISINKRRGVLHRLNTWRRSHTGVQFIVASRPMNGLSLARDLARKPIVIKISPLTKDDIDEILSILKQPLPPENSQLREILTNPFFCDLYLETGSIKQTEAAGYPLAFREARTTGAIIWNYLQRELLRKPSEDWVYSCALACEYIMPRIAWEMVSRNSVTIEQQDAVRLIDKTLAELRPDRLPKHLTAIWRHYEMQHFLQPELDKTDWHGFVLDELGLLTPQRGITNGRHLAFPHQVFQNCLAGLYLVNQAEATQDDEFPTVWSRMPKQEVLNYAAELMDDETSIALWHNSLLCQPSNRAANCSMLELQYRRGAPLLALDYTGMDLRGLPLERFFPDSERESFIRLAQDQGVQLDSDVFQPYTGAGDANCVAVTEDEYCVAGFDDGVLRFFDMRTGQFIREFQGHTGKIRCVAVTGDERCISGANDNSIRMWDIRTGECLYVLNGHSGPVNCVATAADSLLVSGSVDGTLRVWNTDSGTCIRTMSNHFGSVTCVAVTADGYCVSGSVDHTLRVWDINSGTVINVLKGHTDLVRCVAVSAKGLIASGSRDGTVRIWDIRTGQALSVLEGHIGGVRCLAFSTDGLCVSGSMDKKLRVWNTENGSMEGSLESHYDKVRCVDISGSDLCVSGSADGRLLVWDIHALSLLHELFLRKSAPAFSADQPSETPINSFFQQYKGTCPSYNEFLAFLRDNNSADLRAAILKELSFLFSISGDTNTITPVHSDHELQELLYRLYLIDTDRMHVSKIVCSADVTPIEPVVSLETSEPLLLEQSPEQHDSEQVQQTGISRQNATNLSNADATPSKPNIGKAVEYFLQDLAEWLRTEKNAIITEPPTKSKDSEQAGYDIGIAFKIGRSSYKLCFAISDSAAQPEVGDNCDLDTGKYVRNILQFFYGSDMGINNRWIWVNPSSDLSDGFAEKFFPTWNHRHYHMQIAAITNNNSLLRCVDFFSVNENAFKAAYPDREFVPVDQEKWEQPFREFYENYVGNDRVKQLVDKTLQRFSIPEDYCKTQVLLSEQTGDGCEAISEIMRLLVEMYNEPIGTSEENRGIYIIGEYGTGKTWLIYQAIEALVRDHEKHQFLPALLRLKEINRETARESKSKRARQFVDKTFIIHDGFEEDQANSRLPVVFIDGFDEALSGLSATNEKVEILLAVFTAVKSKLKSLDFTCDPIFIVTSRESDYKACSTNTIYLENFKKFYKVELQDCSIEDARKKLEELSRIPGIRQESLQRIKENDSLVKLVCRPGFFGLMTSLIKNGDSSFEGVEDAYTLLDRVIQLELHKTRKEFEQKKGETIRDWARSCPPFVKACTTVRSPVLYPTRMKTLSFLQIRN